MKKLDPENPVLQRKDQLSPVEVVATSTPQGELDLARQEFKAEADTSNILRRFGAGSAFGVGRAGSGEVDYTMDLQSSIAAVEAAKAAWRRLPPDAQAYRSWPALEAAIQRGEYPKKPAEPLAASAGGSGGSASDSAPVTPPKVS